MNLTRREVRADFLNILEKIDDNIDKIFHISINQLVNENSNNLGDWREPDSTKMIIEFIF